MTRRLLVRADANAAIGSGHAMRCLGLAQAFVDDGHGTALFAMVDPPAAVRSRIERGGVEVVPIGSGVDAFAAYVGRERPDVVVLDGYLFAEPEQSAAKSNGALLAVVDDNREVPLALADVVINQNAHAARVDYGDLGAERVLGLSHAMLRREVRRAAAEPFEVRSLGRRVLVSMGGSDPAGLTVSLVRALADGTCDVVALVGGAGVAVADVEARLAGMVGVSVLPPQDDIVGCFRAADVVVSGAGSTLWELCALGVPSMAITVADNQRELPAELERIGAGVALGDARTLVLGVAAGRVRTLLADASTRERMARLGRVAVDGGGASRVASRLAACADRRTR